MNFSYAAPLTVERPEDCFFYHKINIPGLGDVGEQWDLRSSIDDYLGKFDFRGKRVLDMGTASGFLTFEMEKRGAEVVSFDMVDGTQWDIVPHHNIQKDIPRPARSRRQGPSAPEERLLVHAPAPELEGPRLLRRHLRLAGRTGRVRRRHFRHDPLPPARSLPGALLGVAAGQGHDHRHEPDDGYEPADWQLHPEPRQRRADGVVESVARLLDQMLEILGFSVKSTTESKPLCLVKGRERPEPCTSLIAKRVAGTTVPDRSAKAPKLAA